MDTLQNTKSSASTSNSNSNGNSNDVRHNQIRHTWPQYSSAATASSSSPAPLTRPRTIQFAGDILEDWLLFERKLCCYGPLTRAFIAEELDSLPDRGPCSLSAGSSRGRGRVRFLQQEKEEHNVKGELKRRIRSPSPCPCVGFWRKRSWRDEEEEEEDEGVSVATDEDEEEDGDEDTPPLQLIRLNAYSDALPASSISEEAIERWVSEHQERWFRDQLHQFDLRQRQLRPQSQPQAQVGGPVERERGRTGHVWSQSYFQVRGPRGTLGERERRGRMSGRREAWWVVRYDGLEWDGED